MMSILIAPCILLGFMVIIFTAQVLLDNDVDDSIVTFVSLLMLISTLSIILMICRLSIPADEVLGDTEIVGMVEVVGTIEKEVDTEAMFKLKITILNLLDTHSKSDICDLMEITSDEFNAILEGS